MRHASCTAAGAAVLFAPLLVFLADSCAKQESARVESTQSASQVPAPISATDSIQAIERLPASERANADALRQLFPKSSASQLAVLVARYKQISTALHTSSGSFTAVDRGNQWAAWAALTAASVGPDVDEMVAILSAPAQLEDGTVITQEFNEGLGSMTSAAACTAEGLRILYDPHSIVGLLPPGLLFLKYHEMGHVFLKHIVCTRVPQLLPDYQEKEADCWAAKQLLDQGLRGGRAIDMAAAFLQTQNDPATGPYVSSKSRASYLYHRCQ